MKDRQNGHALVESVMGIVVLVFVCLAIFDLSIIIWGVQINATTCQAAARAAGRGDPGEAMQRAQAVIDRKGESAGEALVSNPHLFGPVQVSLTSMPKSLHDPLTGVVFNPGGPIVGSVTVITEAVIHPFVLRILLPNQKSLTVKSEQTFPLTYVMPSSTPDNSDM